MILQEKLYQPLDTKDQIIRAQNSALPLRGIPHLHTQRHRISHQIQARTRSTQYIEEPTPFTKFIKMADRPFTKRNMETVNKKEAIHRDQPHQAIPKNPWSVLDRDQEPDALTNKTDLMAPELDKSPFDPSLEEQHFMDGTHLTLLLQKLHLNLGSWRFHRLK